MASATFDSLIHIRVGKGDKVLFWKDRWLNGSAVGDIAHPCFNWLALDAAMQELSKLR
jgi:hypothetical protein